MDKQRAKEILSSTDMINVTYNGTPVYINSINDSNETASIHPIDQTNDVQEVSLNNLLEQ